MGNTDVSFVPCNRTKIRLPLLLSCRVWTSRHTDFFQLSPIYFLPFARSFSTASNNFTWNRVTETGAGNVCLWLCTSLDTSFLHLSFTETLNYDPINLLKPTGYVMHHQFNIQQLYALPTPYLYVLYLSENKRRLEPLTA